MTKRPINKPGVFTHGLDFDFFKESDPDHQSRAMKDKQARINWLIKKGATEAKAKRLAKRLKLCVPEEPCVSALCPVCSYAAADLFKTIVMEFVGPGAVKQTLRPDERAFRFMVAPRQPSKPAGTLSELPMKKVQRHFTDCLGKAGITIAAGVLTPFFVQAENDDCRAWRWKLSGILIAKDKEEAEEGLNSIFKVGPQTKGLARIFPVSEQRQGITNWAIRCYPHHLSAYRAVYDLDVTAAEIVKLNLSVYPERITNSDSEKMEFFKFLGGLSLDARILTKGAQLRAGSDGCRLIRLDRIV